MKVFITGSSDGLGMMAARLLIEQGHDVVLHARNEKRAKDTKEALPQATSILIGDLSSIAETCHLADQVNQLGPFDSVIHNAGIGDLESQKIVTEDGLPHVFAINTLAPYILTAKIKKPKRLIYLSSESHYGMEAHLDDLLWKKRPWKGMEAYGETKLHDVLFAFAVARWWPDVFSNAVDPGWVPTKMGGASAPDDLDQGHRTQSWLAVSNDKAAQTKGQFFRHMHTTAPNPIAYDTEIQDALMQACAEISGISITAR